MGNSSSTRILLFCGVLSSLYYVAINGVVPLFYPGYDHAGLMVSELSAIGAPTRTLWVWLAVVYILLFAAFGLGVVRMAGEQRRLARTGRLLIVYAALNLYWPPMHMRGHPPGLTDALHIGWAMVTLVLMMLIMWQGAAVAGRGFHTYSAFTFVVFLVFGGLMGTEAPLIARGQPTPHIGLWERINIGAFMLWVIVFAAYLLRGGPARVPEDRGKLVIGN